MRASLKIFILIGCVLYANAERRYGGRCRDMRCAPSEQCIGFYETCQKGQTEGTDCGSYPTCVQREGQVILPDRPAPSSSASQGDDVKDREKNAHHVSSPSDGDGNLYPSLPNQPSYPSSGNNYPAAPNTGGYTPPHQPAYGGQGGQSGYPTAPNAGGYSPPQQPAYGGQGGQGGQSGYPGAYPNYPAPNNPQPNYPSPNYPPPGYPAPSSGNKGSSSDSGGSGFSSFLNLFGGGNRGSSNSAGGGTDFGSILNILGSAGGSRSGSSGGNRGGSDNSHGPDLSSLLQTFGGGGGGGGSGSLESTALNSLINQFRGSGGNRDSGYGGNNNNNYDRSHNPNPYGAGGAGGAGQYGAGSSDPSQGGGSSLLSSLSNFATSPIGSQLIQRALQANRDSDGMRGGESVQNRRFGGLFSENPSSNSPATPVTGAGSRGYPTQAPYRPNYPVQPSETQRTYSSNDREPSSSSETSDKPKPYGWNVRTD